MAEFGYREPTGDTDLLCPKCPHRVWVSPEDADASLGEMHNHLLWEHCDVNKEAALALLAKVKEVPSA